MRRVALVATGALVVVVAAAAWLGVARPMLRHDRAADRVGSRLSVVVRSVVGPPREDAASWVGSSPPGANGGYCWLYARVTVATPLAPTEVVARIERVLDPLDVSVDAEREADGVVRVTGAALGDGGTLDPRCG